MRIGLTGGIGSGKSTVAGFLREAGAALIDTDAISRALTLAGGVAMPAIQQQFGADFVTADGALERDRMRTLIFSDAGAKRRLEAIQQMEELGSGFYLAMHDLEIRGAGEVLGDKQSGEIHEIGFQLYTDMLNAAVKSLKAGKEPDLMAPLAATTEINLGTPALLPNDYCADVHERLSIYKCLANCEAGERVDDIQEELIDRFGRLPSQAQALIETHRLRIAAAPLGVRKIDAGEATVSMQFVPNPPIDAIRIIDLVQKNRHIKLAGQDKLRIEAKMPDVATRAQTIKHTLRQLA